MSAVNQLFIGSSNQISELRAGLAAALSSEGVDNALHVEAKARPWFRWPDDSLDTDRPDVPYILGIKRPRR